MHIKTPLYYLAMGMLIVGIFIGEVECRRKILRGRKTITRRYYRGTAIPAWSIVLLTGLGMLIFGGGLYVLLKKFIVDAVDVGEMRSYQPALQDEV